MRPGKVRDRVFATMIKYADRTEQNKGKGSDQEAAGWENKFYDRAFAAAQTPMQGAQYRLSRAAFDHIHADYAAEVQLCQEILSDDAMREAMLNDEQSGGTAAANAISLAVAIKPEVYQPIEQKAGVAYTAAREANNPEQLLAVATVYPNSHAAGDARLDAVHRFEAGNQPDKAISVMRTLYAGSNESGARCNLLIAITNDFLTMPDGIGPAVDRLCRAAKITPSTTLAQPLRLPGGTVLGNQIRYVDAVAKLRQMQADRDNAALADFHLEVPDVKSGVNPFVRGVPPKIENVLTLVHPLHDFDHPSEILTWGPVGLSIYTAGATLPRASVPQIDKVPLGAAFTNDHWIIWTASNLYQIDGQGKLAWEFPLVHLPTLVVSAGSEGLINVSGDADDGLGAGGNPQVFNVNGQVVRIRGNGNARVLMRMNGLNIVQPPQPAVIPPLHGGDEQIVNVLPGGDRIVMSTSTGRLLSLDLAADSLAGKPGQPTTRLTNCW